MLKKDQLKNAVSMTVSESRQILLLSATILYQHRFTDFEQKKKTCNEVLFTKKRFCLVLLIYPQRASPSPTKGWLNYPWLQHLCHPKI